MLELDFGGLDGAPLREMRSLYPDFFEHWTRDPETAVFPDGGETLRALQDRAWALVESITRSHAPDANVILVSHAFAIYSMMCRALGMPLANYGRLRLGPGSVSLLVSRTANVIGPADEVQWALTSLNVLPPLVADGGLGQTMARKPGPRSEHRLVGHVRDMLTRHGYTGRGARLLAGVSGGPDSTALMSPSSSCERTADWICT